MSVNEANPTDFDVLRQHITELEAENAELRKENTVIPDLKNKLSLFDAEVAELKRRNAETLRSNEEYNERHDAENAKLKARIEELKKNKADSLAENVRHDEEVAELLKAELRDADKESKQPTKDICEVVVNALQISVIRPLFCHLV
ncbi:unnamed protein product [Rhizophagus irregularis]|nr:unnamed protein product [Rhizophagus irregularis]